MKKDRLNRLRDAVASVPDDATRRLAYGDALLATAQPAEAEKEYRVGLALDPANVKLKSGLAHAFFKQDKSSEALVVVEELAKSSNVYATVLVLYARLLHQRGDVDRAARQYRRAIDIDAASSDPALAKQLGLQTPRPVPGMPDFDDFFDDDLPFGDGPSERRGPALERPTIRFDDVGGLEGLKDEIRMKIIHPLTHADLYKAYGKKPGGGILLYGPPGCGKTFLARATAGEIKAGFIPVGISEVMDMWIGSGEKNLHDVFEQARMSKPCVLFFDEVDALAASRTDMRTHGGRHLINQFLSELDGVSGDNDGVLILAATNAPWHVDNAFRRPGRFDRVLFVPPPDAPARAAILKVLLKDRPVDDIDHDAVAKKTEGFSGADLKGVVDGAIEAKLKEAMKAGIPKPITTKDLLHAAAGLKPTTRDWFGTAKNYALYSNQGGTYDEILKYLKL